MHLSGTFKKSLYVDVVYTLHSETLKTGSNRIIYGLMFNKNVWKYKKCLEIAYLIPDLCPGGDHFGDGEDHVS